MRKVVFANDEIYHVFNCGVERRPVFTLKKNYERAVAALDFYRFKNLPLRLANALVLEKETKENFFTNLRKQPKLAEIICYCLMPNHFHFLVKQKSQNGIPKFLSDFTNSYTRYFNTRNKRIGPLFQGIFKAVRIEKDEQLIHVSRYIHLNPVVSLIIKEEELDTYPWSSFPGYLNPETGGICSPKIILSFFSSPKDYRKFVHNQIDYAKKLEKIKHLAFD